MARKGKGSWRLRLFGALLLIALIGGAYAWWTMIHWRPESLRTGISQPTFKSHPLICSTQIRVKSRRAVAKSVSTLPSSRSISISAA